MNPVSSKQGAVLEGNGTLKQHHLNLKGLNDVAGYSVDFIIVING